MQTGLQRDLGLAATTAIAIGAMVGAGIFILPGIAYPLAGPAVVLAYLLAGLLVLPAVLSAAEMATAMPEDGGSYVYVERGMGPVLGTIAGIGNWFMLSFKGALALIGGVPYLVFLSPGLAEYMIPIALALAVLFTVINVVSTKSTGQLQFAIVGVLVLAMGFFVLAGIPSIDTDQTSGALNPTGGGILAATGLVFVSYAGVIKIAAVAEEVKDPGRTIPLAMLIALVSTTLIYALVVFVAIGIAPELSPGGGFVPIDGEEAASIATAAEAGIGEVGALIMVLAAILALASTANAGLLSASRFPFAMARDSLVPSRFEHLHPRFKTPSIAVVVTGVAMMVMIATLPIEQVAKFGSAFQLVVFILVNLAVIGFREGAVNEYEPTFVAPLYPWIQIIGMAGGLIVLTQMGMVAIAGAVVIALIAVGWYLIYARPRIEREGAARAGMRKSVGERELSRTKAVFDSKDTYQVLVAITGDTSSTARRDMVRMASDLGRIRSTIVTVVEFVDVPHRIFGEEHVPVPSGAVPRWVGDALDGETMIFTHHQPIRGDGGITRSSPSPTVEYRRIDTEDHHEAIVEFAAFGGYDLLITERRQSEFHRGIFGGKVDWLLRHAPCDVMLVDDNGFDGADEIAVVANRGSFEPLKLLIADALAEETDATIHLLQAISRDAPDSHRETIERYHQALISILTVPTRSTVIETDDAVKGLSRFIGDAELVVTGVDRTGPIARLLGRPGNRLVDSIDATAVMVQSRDDRRPGLVERLLMEHLFG